MNLMKFSRTYLIAVITATQLLLASGAVNSQELPPIPLKKIQKHPIKNAIQVQITPKGMLYFEHKMKTILGNIGFSLDEGYLDEIKWESDKSYDLDQLNVPPEAKDLIQKLRTLLSEWFVGFSLKEVRPAIEIGNSGYIAQLNRFALVTDRNLMTVLGKKEGAILALELEIKELTAATNRFRAYDMNNTDLGQVGFDNLSLKIGGGQEPLKIRLPFYITLNNKREIEFQAVQVEQNLDQVDINFQYRELIAPDIKVLIGKKEMTLDKRKLKNEFDARFPEALNKIRNFLADLAEKDLPAFLNKKAKESLQGSIEEINRMDPPGADPTKPTLGFFWGLQLNDINLDEKLSVELNAYVEDPMNITSQPVNTSQARGEARFQKIPTDQYDISMSIDRGMLNRILQLSFERKLFEKITIGDEDPSARKITTCRAQTDPAESETQPKTPKKDQYLKITRAPIIDAVPLGKFGTTESGEGLVKVRVQALVPPGTVTGIQRIALRDNFEVAFDMIAKLKNAPDGGGLKIYLWDIDMDSVWVNPDYLTPVGKLFKGKVMNNIKEEFQKMTALWRCDHTAIPGKLPLPPEILSIKLDIQELEMEQNGQLVMYMNYAKPVTKMNLPARGEK